MSTLFVGLGRMGAPMARRHAAEQETVVLDVDAATARAVAAEAGCAMITEPGERPAGCDTVVLMLPDSATVESVLLDQGLLAGLPAGALVIDMSSSVPESTRALAPRAARGGVGYVDAPVSGGVAKARTGELTVMAGGSTDDVERARPHLRPLATTVLHVGGPGAGHAAKALNNLASAANLAAAAEVLVVARSFGIAPEAMVEVLNASTGRSQASEVKYPRHVLTGTWDSGFAMDLMIKDLGIALDLAAEHGVAAPVVTAVREAATRARRELGDAPDHTELARWYEVAHGIRLRHGDGNGARG
jgi:3-hydroxyisobutyrate dehydrogenase